MTDIALTARQARSVAGLARQLPDDVLSVEMSREPTSGTVHVGIRRAVAGRDYLLGLDGTLTRVDDIPPTAVFRSAMNEKEQA